MSEKICRSKQSKCFLHLEKIFFFSLGKKCFTWRKVSQISLKKLFSHFLHKNTLPGKCDYLFSPENFSKGELFFSCVEPSWFYLLTFKVGENILFQKFFCFMWVKLCQWNQTKSSCLNQWETKKSLEFFFSLREIFFHCLRTKFWLEETFSV